ncbi:MAG: HAD family hydrolase [Candidatus Melainabacteria bacterium]|nr:HAD family hydrolase [Candidatus Melainabacteria bacterium]
MKAPAPLPSSKTRSKKRASTIVALSILLSVFASSVADAKEKTDTNLGLWNDSARKNAIVDFVKAVTDEKSPDYVKPSERIAVFDNDGTLWCEQPNYPQVVFIVDKAKAYAQTHPEVKDKPLFKAVLDGDLAALGKAGARGSQELIGSTYHGLTVDQYSDVVTKWMESEKHPRFHQPYTSCVYQPMIEVIAYLQKHDFKNYIVSGGGAEFMRPWTEEVYDIPPERVIGSMIKLQFKDDDGQPEIVRTMDIDFICDSSQKPVAIEK